MIYRYVSYRGHIISNHPWNCVIGSCNCRTLIKSIVTVNSIEFNYSPSTLIHTWLIMKAIVRHFFFFFLFLKILSSEQEQRSKVREPICSSILKRQSISLLDSTVTRISLLRRKKRKKNLVQSCITFCIIFLCRV